MTSTSIYQEIPVSQSKTELFILKAKLIHVDLYNYESVEYIKSNLKVKIECVIHGIFEQSPNHHLSGCGCPKCSLISQRQSSLSNSEKFINKAKLIHNNIYEYTEVMYVNAITKVKIECKLHGIFEQIPASHLSGHGCLKCTHMPKFTVLEKRAKSTAKSNRRRAAKSNSTPKWAEFDLITQLYTECSILSDSTGIKYQIDHTIPLMSDLVCGLHCLANLRIILEKENLAKGNRYWPDMP